MDDSTPRDREAESPPSWVEVAVYSARYLAEIPIQTLEGAGIPVLVKGEEPGIWGPAFSGPTLGGIRLLVPAAAADDARELLHGEPTGDFEDEEVSF
jgi:hypothetical protein